jgi:quercetin dioxygenase-like cupin family protein
MNARAPDSLAPDADPIWPCWIREFDEPFEENASGWNIYRIFNGSTPAMESFGTHVSVLSAGTTPHPPHAHVEEELIIMLSGEAEILRFDDPTSDESTSTTIGPGAFLYHSAYHRHTIRGAGPGPATYLIFKWKNESGANDAPELESSILRFDDDDGGSGTKRSNGWTRKRLLDSPTRYLRKLHCHLSVLEQGAGYRPHADPYDVAILVLEGTLETLGRKVGRHGVIFYAAGEPHGMGNVGPSPASYLVFEFHGGTYAPRFRPKGQRRPWYRRLATRTLKRLRQLVRRR